MVGVAEGVWGRGRWKGGMGGIRGGMGGILHRFTWVEACHHSIWVEIFPP